MSWLSTLGKPRASTENARRDGRVMRFIDTVKQDLKYAVRGLRKSPGFTAAAVLSLALGIGANTAIFSLIDSVMLQLLPVRDPQQLMFVGTKTTRVGSGIRVSQSLDTTVLHAVREHSTLLDGASGVQAALQLSVQAGGGPEIVSGDFVDGAYFRVLGVPAIVGRVLSPEDDRPEGLTGLGWPVVISYSYWQTHFTGRPDIVGQQLSINRIPFVIIGVTPRDFHGLQLEEDSRLMMPITAAQQVSEGKLTPVSDDKPQRIWALVVRLKPGVTSAAAEAELTVLVRNALAAEPGMIPVIGDLGQLVVELTPASRGISDLRKQFSTALTVLMAVVGLVLLIACANLANLLLARGSARQKEIAIRLSLGCTRARLAGQLLLECLLLSTLGAALGVLFAVWARQLVVQLATAADTSSPSLPMQWDLRLLLFAGVMCVVTTLLFGLAPALRATCINSAEVLKAGRTSGMSGRATLSNTLVAVQVAVSLILLVGAALCLGTLRNLYRVQLGYNERDLMLMTVNPRLAGYGPERSAEFFDQVLQRVQVLPQVESASWTQIPILGPYVGLRSMRVPGYVPQVGEKPKPWVLTYSVGPGFFHTMQMPVVIGREFGEQDRRGAPLVGMMNQVMARHFFGQTNPIGRKISLVQSANASVDVEIVGIARDAKYRSMRDENEEVLFMPVLQQDPPAGWATLVVRTAPGSSQAAANVAAAVRDADANVPMYDFTTMERQRDGKMSRERLMALLTGFFSLLALLLSAIGLYGVLAYRVSQRTGEIGIRMALGARRATIFRMICWETARVIGTGLCGGVVITVFVTRVIRGMLFGIAPTDVRSLFLAVIILSAVAFVAALLPMSRAMRVDPMVALRSE